MRASALSKVAHSRLPRAMIAAAAMVLAGCGDEQAGDDGPRDPAEGSTCASEDRAEAFSAGMSKTGEAGVTVAIESSDPAPPAQGDNIWILSVSDGSGAAAGATVAITPKMPDHGHGGPSPEITDQGDGAYEAAPVNFPMGGYWEMTVSVETAGGTTDEVMFPICIE